MGWSVGVPSPMGGCVWGGAMWCSLPRKNNVIFLNGMCWCILSELVRRLLWCNSLQLWCVYTVTKRFYYQNWLTCTAVWNFPVKYTTANQQMTTLEGIRQWKRYTLCLIFFVEWPPKLVGFASILGTPSGKSGHVHPSPPRGDAHVSIVFHYGHILPSLYICIYICVCVS